MDPQTIPQLNPSGAKTIADVPHAAAIKHPNWFIHFSENIGHAIVDIFKWAPTVANKVIFVLEAESKLTPEFLSALKTFITDAAVVAHFREQSRRLKLAQQLLLEFQLSQPQTFKPLPIIWPMMRVKRRNQFQSSWLKSLHLP